MKLERAVRISGDGGQEGRHLAKKEKSCEGFGLLSRADWGSHRRAWWLAYVQLKRKHLALRAYMPDSVFPAAKKTKRKFF